MLRIRNEEFARWWTEWIRRIHVQRDSLSKYVQLTEPMDRDAENADPEFRVHTEDNIPLITILDQKGRPKRNSVK